MSGSNHLLGKVNVNFKVTIICQAGLFFKIFIFMLKWDRFCLSLSVCTAVLEWVKSSASQDTCKSQDDDHLPPLCPTYIFSIRPVSLEMHASRKCLRQTHEIENLHMLQIHNQLDYCFENHGLHAWFILWILHT